MNHPQPVSHPPPQDTDADLTFIVPQSTKPYFESSALTGGEPKVYFRTERRQVRIRDLRPLADTLSLDGTGVVLRHHATAVGDLNDDRAIEQIYGPELQALLREFTGADRVIVFDYTRRSDAERGASNPDGYRGPASRVHVDYTTDSGPVRARDALGADTFEQVLAAGGRIMQVNVWRPITGPVKRAPLAVADASSIAASELVATDQRFPDRVGEIYSLAHGPGQRWYWVPDMARDEVLLLKGWDSIDDGRARFTPHGAFELPGQDPTAPPRQSIEARAYLIFDA